MKLREADYCDFELSKVISSKGYIYIITLYLDSLSSSYNLEEGEPSFALSASMGLRLRCASGISWASYP